MKILENYFAYPKDGSVPVGTIVVAILLISFLGALIYLFVKRKKTIYFYRATKHSSRQRTSTYLVSI